MKGFFYNSFVLGPVLPAVVFLIPDRRDVRGLHEIDKDRGIIFMESEARRDTGVVAAARGTIFTAKNPATFSDSSRGAHLFYTRVRRGRVVSCLLRCTPGRLESR